MQMSAAPCLSPASFEHLPESKNWSKRRKKGNSNPYIHCKWVFMRYATYLKCQCRAIFANTSINCIYENETLTLAVRELLGGGKKREGNKKEGERNRSEVPYSACSLKSFTRARMAHFISFSISCAIARSSALFSLSDKRWLLHRLLERVYDHVFKLHKCPFWGPIDRVGSDFHMTQ